MLLLVAVVCFGGCADDSSSEGDEDNNGTGGQMQCPPGSISVGGECREVQDTSNGSSTGGSTGNA
ncbi:MAG: hypothetical protein AAFS10_04500, partial [Myxococcota bacterium]